MTLSGIRRTLMCSSQFMVLTNPSLSSEGRGREDFQRNLRTIQISPPPLGHPTVCDSAALPVHTHEEFFCTGDTEASQCAPAPNGGRAGARGAIIPHETGFLQSRSNFEMQYTPEQLPQGVSKYPLKKKHAFFHEERRVRRKKLVIRPERNVIIENLDFISLGCCCPDLDPVDISHLRRNR
jgi:hypothetical protein